MKYSKVYTVLVAAGSGSRMNSLLPKQLMSYGSSTVLATAAKRFCELDRMDSVVVVSPPGGKLDKKYEDILDVVREETGKDIFIVNGGKERADSVKAGLFYIEKNLMNECVNADETLVLIHDAARPGITGDIIEENIRVAEEHGAVVTAVPSIDSVRIISDKNNQKIKESSLNDDRRYPIIGSTVVDRQLVYNVQTPQTFVLSNILSAYEIADREGYIGTDDASIMEYAGFEVAIVLGARSNNKITTQEDILMTTRVGTGYDVHKLVPGRALILCGTPVPSEMGLMGHSDADVATHAIMDALLGAAGMGDIGRHFPDNDDRYKGADSLKLLAEVKRLIGDAVINNIDVTIIAQAPKIAPYNKQMTENIAKTLGIAETAINIKATTEEGLGFTGRREGIAAIATCAIEGRF
ncbi:MAG: 2-C-methyl-D-erythritol 2,4-cyclodiphosphate synthase [Clostridiales bacterium]|nr:2-C-methyl-D-erythritol 2,4-cyclodiphosphate synthase [Clostridiales bacterium]